MIGMTKSGNVLMEMDESDVCNLQLVCKCIQQFATELSPGQDGKAEPVETLTASTTDRGRPVPAKRHYKARKTTEATEVATSNSDSKRKCQTCGGLFVPRTVKSRFCSKACIDKDYNNRKMIAKSGSGVTCVVCKKQFERKRKDQTCCSTECRRKIPTRSYPEVKAELKKPVQPVQPPAPAETTKLTRLELIKRMARKGVINSPGFAERSPVAPNLEDIPEFKRAQREAGEG